MSLYSDTPEYPFVSVVMPVRNEEAFIEECLQSVLSQDYPLDRMEIIVADGMSTDRTREIIGKLSRDVPPVQIVDNPRKIAPTALNIATARSKGDIVARVDGHCAIAPDYIRRCVDHLRSGEFDGVGGPIETIGDTATAQVIAAAMSSPFGVGGSAFRTGNTNTKIVDSIAFPVYTRDVITRAGHYDEQLVRNQDDEYNYRLRKMGAKLLLASDVKSKYYSRASFRKLARQYFQYGLWKVRVLQKHPRQMRARQFAPPVFVGLLVTLVFSSLVSQYAVWILIALLVTYFVANLLATGMTWKREYGVANVALPLAFMTLHVAYGAGFLCGLVRFSRYWFSATT